MPEPRHETCLQGISISPGPSTYRSRYNASRGTRRSRLCRRAGKRRAPFRWVLRARRLRAANGAMRLHMGQSQQKSRLRPRQLEDNIEAHMGLMSRPVGCGLVTCTRLQ